MYRTRIAIPIAAISTTHEMRMQFLPGLPDRPPDRCRNRPVRNLETVTTETDAATEREREWRPLQAGETPTGIVAGSSRNSDGVTLQGR